jgi:hypothetical protein
MNAREEQTYRPTFAESHPHIHGAPRRLSNFWFAAWRPLAWFTVVSLLAVAARGLLQLLPIDSLVAEKVVDDPMRVGQTTEIDFTVADYPRILDFGGTHYDAFSINFDDANFLQVNRVEYDKVGDECSWSWVLPNGNNGTGLYCGLIKRGTTKTVRMFVTPVRSGPYAFAVHLDNNSPVVIKENILA